MKPATELATPTSAFQTPTFYLDGIDHPTIFEL
jgi:hypothetical protein